MGQSMARSNEELRGAATAIDQRRQRKKIQNRLNQRSYRLRNQDKRIAGIPKTDVEHCQYRIDRWRLDEHQYQTRAFSRHAGSSDRESTIFPETSKRLYETTWFPLPSDHLLHLIKYNVFRGLFKNKATLDCLAVQFRTADLRIEALSDHTRFLGRSVILPVAPSQPSSLMPTYSQMNVVHSSWINVLPFPTMRDTLIRSEFEFDHADFVKDLVGELINLHIFPSAKSSPGCTVAGGHAIIEGHEDGAFGATTGLIVWGEPHIAGNWEATPHFLQKWAWVVKDCQELISSTNYWRETRGEMPLSFDRSQLQRAL